MGRLSGGFGGLTAQHRQPDQYQSALHRPGDWGRWLGQRTQPGAGGNAMGSFWDRWREWRSARQRPQLPQRWGSRFGMSGELGGYGMNRYEARSYGTNNNFADSMQLPQPTNKYLTSFNTPTAQPTNKYLTSADPEMTWFNTPTAQPDPRYPFVTHRQPATQAVIGGLPPVQQKGNTLGATFNRFYGSAIPVAAADTTNTPTAQPNNKYPFITNR